MELQASLWCYISFARMNTTGVVLCCSMLQTDTSTDVISRLILSSRNPEVNHLIWNFNTLSINNRELGESQKIFCKSVYENNVYKYINSSDLKEKSNNLVEFLKNHTTPLNVFCEPLWGSLKSIYSNSGVKLKFCPCNSRWSQER